MKISKDISLSRLGRVGNLKNQFIANDNEFKLSTFRYEPSNLSNSSKDLYHNRLSAHTYTSSRYLFALKMRMSDEVSLSDECDDIINDDRMRYLKRHKKMGKLRRYFKLNLW